MGSWLPGCPSIRAPLCVTLGRFPLPSGLSGAELPPGLQLLSLTFSVSELSGQMPRAASHPGLRAPLQAGWHGWAHWGQPLLSGHWGDGSKTGGTAQQPPAPASLTPCEAAGSFTVGTHE